VRRAWFERGLLRIEAHTRRFLAQRMVALVGTEAYAWLEHVRFSSLTNPGLDKLMSGPFLRSVTGLHIEPTWEQSQSLRLAGRFGSNSVAGLQSLFLSGVRDLEDIIARLLVSPHLPCMKALGLEGGPLSEARVTALAHSPRLAHLTHLGLYACYLSADHIRELIASPVLQRVTVLGLGQNRLNDSSLEYLASSPFCRSLTGLNLAACGNITAAGIAHLTHSPHLSGLQLLDLSWCHVGREGARLFAGSTHLSQLTTLGLRGSWWVGDPTPHNQSVDEEAVAILAHSPHLARLTTLDLPGNGLGLQAAKALASSSSLGHLTSLNLAHNRIGYEGAVALARSPILSHVFFLDLSSNLIRRTGARALAESPYLQPGATLRLAGNHLDEADQALLRERFGDRVELSARLPEQRE
jgi:hypothetical protein